METFNNIFKQIASFYGSLSPAKKIGLVFTVILLGAILSAIFMWAGEGEYVVLFSGLDVKEAQEVKKKLNEMNVSTKSEAGDTTIKVPKSQAAKLRMDLTSLGVTQGGKILGYELIDKTNLGTTNYVQQINYRRALEGELIKSIKSINGVIDARVHIVIPENKTFLVDQKKPTASVVLKLKPGKIIEENNIRGISNLVASAVEGLNLEDVAILDSTGALLSSSDRDEITKISNDQLRYQKKLEDELQTRILTILNRVAGPGNVEAKVTAELDFTKESTIEEMYNPDGSVLLSQVTTSEKFDGSKANPSGIPGSRTNLPGQNTAIDNPETKQTHDRTSETVNYNVSKKVTNTVKPSALIKKLSVSVLVNSEQVESADKKTKTYKKREDLKELELLAKNSIGFNDKRGDVFTIESLAFKDYSFEEDESFLKQLKRWDLIKDFVWFGIVGLMILLLFFFIIRPFINWVVDKTGEEKELPMSIEEIETGQAVAALKEKTLVHLEDAFNPEKAETEALIEKINLIVNKNPAKAAKALKPWINEGIMR